LSTIKSDFQKKKGDIPPPLPGTSKNPPPVLNARDESGTLARFFKHPNHQLELP